jgi:hypothetical protein
MVQSMADEAVAYANYITAMMATYAAMAAWSVASWNLSQCEENNQLRVTPEDTHDHTAERLDCVAHGMKLLAKIDDYDGPESKQLTEARDKLRHAIQQAI